MGATLAGIAALSGFGFAITAINGPRSDGSQPPITFIKALPNRPDQWTPTLDGTPLAVEVLGAYRRRTGRWPRTREELDAVNEQMKQRRPGAEVKFVRETSSGMAYELRDLNKPAAKPIPFTVSTL